MCMCFGFYDRILEGFLNEIYDYYVLEMCNFENWKSNV